MEMGRGAKNCSTTIMNRKKIGEAPQFVKKSYPKMAIFQLEHLRWCLTCLSGGFLRIKFRFFSEFVNESSFSENENLGISFERFLPIFQNPHACTGGQSQQTIAPVSFQNYTRSSNPPPKKLKVYSRKTERKSNFLSTSKAQKWLQELQQ